MACFFQTYFTNSRTMWKCGSQAPVSACCRRQRGRSHIFNCRCSQKFNSWSCFISTSGTKPQAVCREGRRLGPLSTLDERNQSASLRATLLLVDWLQSFATHANMKQLQGRDPSWSRNSWGSSVFLLSAHIVTAVVYQLSCTPEWLRGPKRLFTLPLEEQCLSCYEPL